jgi:hypothetical protein
MYNKKELHLTCSCHTHELHIERDMDDTVPMWFGSFWIRGYSGKHDWKFRARMIWQILKTGTPYGDEIVLERKDMEELLTYVQEQVKLTKITKTKAKLPK